MRKRKPRQAICKQCGKVHYSLTTNKGGLILCVNCDPDVPRKLE